MTRCDIRRVVFPLTLVTVGVCLLIGCIPLPGSYQREGGGERPERKIGGPSSDKPLQLRRSMLQDVLAVLGKPTLATRDRRTLIYGYTIVVNYFDLRCFATADYDADRYLRLELTEDGRLKAFHVYSSFESMKRAAPKELDPWPEDPAPSATTTTTTTTTTTGSGDTQP